MGEAADDIINGLMCEHCGELVDGSDPGYPRLCDYCEDMDNELCDQEEE